ncbi:MAG: exodeoxyribonuclease VII large subunit, partial [Melioribacteraceae bacterium]|nr:exodeoxyribonuclease VII large subunit [Melioribacteraceae bacterium]
SSTNVNSIIANFKDEIFGITNSYGFKSHDMIINNNMQTLDNYLFRIQNGVDQKFQKSINDLNLLNNIVESFNVEKVLERGFALVKQNSKAVTRAKDYDSNKKTKIKFYDKEIEIT